MKRIRDNYGYIVVLVMIFTIGTAFTLPKVLTEENTDTVYYVGEAEDGYLFLQPSSEYENVIFVDTKDVEKWNLDLTGAEVGEEYTATFTGSDLWEVESIAETSK